MKNKDQFSKAPEFLAAFDHISANGFFDKMVFSCEGFESKLGSSCHLEIIGYIPNDVKYAKKGLGVLYDPHAIIASCKKHTSHKIARHLDFTVETTNWKLWDRRGEKVIGSKGTQTKLKMYIQF